MSKPELLIEVYTDVMCPWCWCGEAQLQKTLQSQDFQKEVGTYMKPVVQLKPFILDTRLPATSFEPPSEQYDSIESTEYTKGKPPTKREYYSKKFTSLDAFDAKISARAKELDLPDFVWLSDGKVGATWLVHRLLWYALQQQQNEPQSKNDIYQPGIQERLMQRLFKAFHVESQDMSDINVLSKLACEMKLFESDQEKAKQWLESDQGEYEVGLALEIGMRNGIQSIPFTIVQDGSDHSSQVMNHDDLMRMFTMQVQIHKS